MVLVLPNVEEPSFSSQFARSIGSGLGSSIGQLPQQIMGQRQQRSENEALQRLTGKNVSGLTPELKKVYLEKMARTPEHDRLKEALISKGIGEEDAELYSLLTQGGQTAFVKDLLEKQKRQGQTPKEIEDEELFQVLSSQDEGLTPAEKVSRGKERYTTGLKSYQEAGSKLRGFSRDKERLDILRKNKCRFERRKSKTSICGFS